LGSCTSSMTVDTETGVETDTETDETDTDTDTDTDTETDETDIPAPAAPTLLGEADCGHAAPLWMWSFPVTVDEVRVRLNGETWQSSTPDAGQFRAAGLGEGTHLFEVQGRLTNGLWSTSGSFETVITFHDDNAGYWTGVERKLTTTPLGHAVGINCHNCYADWADNAADNLAATEGRLDDAIKNGADFVELDVRVEGGVWYVAHNEDGNTNRATAESVFALDVLKDADVPLLLEIKETSPTAAQVADLIQNLVDEGYAVNGRPVTLRTFPSRIANFGYAKLALESHPFHAPYFRFHMIYGTSEASTKAGFQTLIQQAADAGYEGIEFGLKTPNLFTLIHTAEALGLGVGLWTVPELMGEIYCAGLREEVDVLTTEYPVNDCAYVAQEDTQLLYVDASKQTAGASEVDYIYDGTQTSSVSLSSSTSPSLIDGGARGLQGSVLEFNAAAGQSLGFHDGDNDANDGYFVVALFQADQLSGSGWETQAVISKADAGGFALELDRTPITVLRYGARVGGSYEYATKPATQLSTASLHMVMGSYDGDGKLRMWVDGTDSGVSKTGTLSGGVVQNDSPIRIGADPQGTSDTRFYFDGAIQLVSVHKWRNH
jgi:glycerophosphoryl diester phosphodiesterase